MTPEVLQLFNQELDTIQNADLRAFTEHVLLQIPAVFWVAAASSSGRFHSKQSLGEGGLVRHTRIAARILVKQIRPYTTAGMLTQQDADIAMAAIILHDTFKRGLNGTQNYCKEHGAIAAAEIYKLGQGYFKDNPSATFPASDLVTLCNAICWHMGPWSTPTLKGVLKSYKDYSLIENLVHLADIASTERALVMTDIEGPGSIGVG